VLPRFPQRNWESAPYRMATSITVVFLARAGHVDNLLLRLLRAYGRRLPDNKRSARGERGC
jgi:hypothetical protein